MVNTRNIVGRLLYIPGQGHCIGKLHVYFVPEMKARLANDFLTPIWVVWLFFVL